MQEIPAYMDLQRIRGLFQQVKPGNFEITYPPPQGARTEGRKKVNVMCDAALKQELNWQIERLPNESVQLLIEVAKSMKPASLLTDESKVERVPRRKAGVLQGHLIYMADDFDETPECFKEYI